LEVVEEAQPTAAAENPVVPSEPQAVAAAPLAFRAIWAIVVRFFKGLFRRDS